MTFLACAAMEKAQSAPPQNLQTKYDLSMKRSSQKHVSFVLHCFPIFVFVLCHVMHYDVISKTTF